MTVRQMCMSRKNHHTAAMRIQGVFQWFSLVTLVSVSSFPQHTIDSSPQICTSHRFQLSGSQSVHGSWPICVAARAS
eukprot:s85_g7.t1